jgi:flagellar biogenesis protein FliO
MKFIRNGRIRDRIIDTVAKGILIAFSALVCLWMISGAKAAGIDIRDIKQHALDNGDYAVEFVLSKSVDKSDVAVEFQRNFIQLSLKGVSAYPARTERLNHALMDKVFTYQYQPDMARARLLLKGQASNVKGQSSWEIDGQTVKIIIGGGSEKAAAATLKDNVKTKASAPTERETAVSADAEEQKAREEITLGAKGDKAEAAASTKAKEKHVDSESLPIFAGQNTAAGAAAAAKKEESPATKVFASLLLVIGVIGAGSLAYRRFVQGKGISLQRQAKMINVLSTQALGPKRSIAIVKVLDQHMVIGMSGDGMNLLANLGADVNMERFQDEAMFGSSGGGGVSFTDTLQGAITGSGSSKGTNTGSVTQKLAGMDMGFRASLKKRLEGFKPL